MSGDWIKLRHDLADDPAVVRMARAMGIDRDTVVGKLYRLWSWTDRHTTDGRACDIGGGGFVDDYLNCPGFAVAMVSVGWLVVDGDCFELPNFDRHNGESAKKRALATVRKQASRFCHADSVTKTGQERDKSVTREEERREEVLPLPREGFDKAAWHALRKAWNAGKGKPWKPVNPHPKAVERMAEPGWLEDAMAAIQRLPQCRFFKTAVSLGQFCGPDFVTLCNGGDYDERNDRGGSRDFADAPPPPKAWTGEAAEALERTRRHLAKSARPE